MRRQFLLSVFSAASIFRLACLFLTVASAVTFYVWSYKPDYISLIDRSLSASYFEKYDTQLADAKALLAAKDYQAAAFQAEMYLREMSHVGKRDRIYPKKRRLYRILITSKLRLGPPHIADALPYAELWTKSNERDVTALEFYIRVLSKMHGKEKELQKALELFHYRYPGKTISVSGVK